MTQKTSQRTTDGGSAHPNRGLRLIVDLGPVCVFFRSASSDKPSESGLPSATSRSCGKFHTWAACKFDTANSTRCSASGRRRETRFSMPSRRACGDDARSLGNATRFGLRSSVNCTRWCALLPATRVMDSRVAAICSAHRPGPAVIRAC